MDRSDIKEKIKNLREKKKFFNRLDHHYQHAILEKECLILSTVCRQSKMRDGRG